MSAPRMNLFKGVKRKEKARARELKRPKLSPQLIGTLAAVAFAAFSHVRANQAHKVKVQALRDEIATLDSQIKEALAVVEAAGKPGRKPAANVKPSGLDGTWTAVLWKFAAFTGQHVVIRNIALAPLQGGGKIQAVQIAGQAASYLEVREWLERLIENMPGSEFSIQNQKLVEDPEFPVAFNLTAQVI